MEVEMKVYFRFFLLLTSFLFLSGGISVAAVNLPLVTTFDSEETVQFDGALGDGLQWYGGWSFGDYRTQVTMDANNPDGNGGRGVRFWVGDGTNVGTGTIIVSFPSPQKELWIRWYMRYKAGFKWTSLGYDKNLYINTASSGISVIPEFYSDRYVVIAQGSPNYYQVQSDNGQGWNAVMGGSVSDGRFHAFEIHLKMDTNGSNGEGHLWIDGVLKASNTAVNWSNNNAVAQNGWVNFTFNSNQKEPDNGGASYVDYDDLVVYNSKPDNVDPNGLPWIGLLGEVSPQVISDVSPSVSDASPPFPIDMLFQESFEDDQFNNRAWYDNVSPVLSSTESISAGTHSVEFNFPAGATKPVAGSSMRKQFAESDAVYVRYYVKYSANWQGSNQKYHPHEFYLLTNKDDAWSGLASTHLTAYIEQNEGVPLLSIQDATNIDAAHIGENLTNVTEYRGVAGCNGDGDGYGDGDCYSNGSAYINGKSWRAGKVYFSDTAGPYYKNDWHKVEAYFKLNSIVDGKAVSDGSVKYWFDGTQVIDNNNVMLRTGQYPEMKFNQFVIAPWIGDGSPIDQTFWVDELVVATPSAEISDLKLSAPKDFINEK